MTVGLDLGSRVRDTGFSMLTGEIPDMEHNGALFTENIALTLCESNRLF